MGYMSRLPNSNDPPRKADPDQYSPEDPLGALVMQEAKRCEQCGVITLNFFLRDGRCPNCRPKDRGE